MKKAGSLPCLKSLILLVEQRGIEPLASALRTRRSAKLSYCPTRMRIQFRVSGFKLLVSGLTLKGFRFVLPARPRQRLRRPRRHLSPAGIENWVAESGFRGASAGTSRVSAKKGLTRCNSLLLPRGRSLRVTVMSGLNASHTNFFQHFVSRWVRPPSTATDRALRPKLLTHGVSSRLRRLSSLSLSPTSTCAPRPTR